MRLKGKTAIVTGATGGIGAATAKRYLQEGANTILVGRSKEKLDDLISNVPFSENALTHLAEATDEGAVIDCMNIAKINLAVLTLFLQMQEQKALFSRSQNTLSKSLIICFP